jgi:peptidoglycan/LPS O-acetylase OafA/YrhL
MAPLAQRYEWLDGLRGIAAILVVISHIGGALDTGVLYFLLLTFNIGHWGVVLFFLVSGYIIPISLQQGQRRFWVRRATRLLPLYWIILLVGIVQQGIDWAALPANLFMVPRLFGVVEYVAGVWTLGIEMVWYLLISILAIRGWHHQPIVVWGVLTIIGLTVDGFIPMIYGQNVLPYGVATYMTIFWAGYCMQRMHAGKLSGRTAWAMLAITGVLVTFPPHTIIATFERGHILPRIAAFALFAVVALWGRSWRWPNSFIWSGQRCYGIYLIHIAILSGLIVPVPDPIQIVIWLVATGLLAELSWRTIEQPWIERGRRF